MLTEEDLDAEDSLVLTWQVLDKAHEKTEDVRADDAYSKWDSSVRKHGQEMDEWIAYVKKAKLEVSAQDPDKVIIQKEDASKLLRGSGLSQRDRAQVKMNCGGAADPARLETVLLWMFPKMGETERKYGQMKTSDTRFGSSLRFKACRNGAARKDTPATKPHAGATPKKDPKTGRFFRKKVHMTDPADEEDGEEEVGRHWADEEVSEDERSGEEQVNAVHMTEDAEPEGESEDNQPPSSEEDSVPLEEAREAFVAGWKAKSKTNDVRKKRGLKPPGNKSPASAKKHIDKKNSTCADCLKTGHWKGDPGCEKVKSGQTPAFSGDKKKGTPSVRGVHSVNWAYMVTKTEFASESPMRMIPRRQQGDLSSEERDEKQSDSKRQ